MGQRCCSLEGLVMTLRNPNPSFWTGKNVLLTGHTGFKGSWLSHLLHSLGADVHGLSIGIPTNPSHFEISRVKSKLASETRGDICSVAVVESVFNEVQPEIVLHLAAQSLVRVGYDDPAGTFNTNILGTVNILEAIRTRNWIRSAVMITTDKVYKNHEWIFPYREIDSLGASDPYSASKAAAEMVLSGYQSSMKFNGAPVAVSARAGNVIGGGDWSTGRLLPDLVRTLNTQSLLEVRSPESTRPWQHVLDPLLGYLLLAESVHENKSFDFPTSWNFGPNVSSVHSVQSVIDLVERQSGSRIQYAKSNQGLPKEHKLLSLDSTQAHQFLSWSPKLDFNESVQWTLDWHSALENNSDMQAFTEDQIAKYFELDFLK
jgi:CDP-glucose 4,6-dehydratase